MFAANASVNELLGISAEHMDSCGVVPAVTPEGNEWNEECPTEEEAESVGPSGGEDQATANPTSEATPYTAAQLAELLGHDIVGAQCSSSSALPHANAGMCCVALVCVFRKRRSNTR
jgi:hypothetical protein